MLSVRWCLLWVDHFRHWKNLFLFCDSVTLLCELGFNSHSSVLFFSFSFLPLSGLILALQHLSHFLQKIIFYLCILFRLQVLRSPLWTLLVQAVELESLFAGREF